MIAEAISLTESKRLIELEATIKRGKQTFVDVGLALAEIRDARLYRADFSTFEDYCREKWGWNSSRARQLIDAAEVSKQVGQSVTTVTLSNERQARELAKVEPIMRVEVLERAAETAEAEERPMTARDIADAAPVRDVSGTSPGQKAVQNHHHTFHIAVADVREQLSLWIRHRPAKRAQLRTVAELLAKASKQFTKFAEKAKE